MRWASLIVNDDDALRIPVSDTLRGPALGKGCGGFHTFLFSSVARGTALRRLTRPPPKETCSLGFSVLQNCKYPSTAVATVCIDNGLLCVFDTGLLCVFTVGNQNEGIELLTVEFKTKSAPREVSERSPELGVPPQR